MTDIIDTALPILFTAISAWMAANVIGMAWVAKQFRDDMRREDLEHHAGLEQPVRARKTPVNHGGRSSR